MKEISQDTNDMLELAKIDYISAKKLEDPYSYSTCKYHQQQCVEKILKAYLIEHKEIPRKTHVLEDLYDDCKKYGLTLNKETDIQLRVLTNFEADSRYIRSTKSKENEHEDIELGWECIETVKNALQSELGIELFDK